jgi:hypothetical protein
VKDFVYVCFNQLPTCLLDALHQYHPTCRLHVHTNKLNSLIQWKDKPHDIDPDEFAWASSPCLYSLAVSYTDHDIFYDGLVDFNGDALLQVVAGLAPQLRFVAVVLGLGPENAVPKPHWQGFSKDDTMSRPSLAGRKGNLWGLDPDRFQTYLRKALLTWPRFTRFEELRTLRLHVDLHDLDILTTLAPTFKSLCKLSLQISRYSDDKVSSLLGSLCCPLHSLELSYAVDSKAFAAALDFHGASLR